MNFLLILGGIVECQYLRDYICFATVPQGLYLLFLAYLSYVLVLG